MNAELDGKIVLVSGGAEVLEALSLNLLQNKERKLLFITISLKMKLNY